MILFSLKRLAKEIYFSLNEILEFYSNPLFRKLDIYQFFQYFWKNPYKIAKQFAIKSGSQNIYSYGETPLTTGYAILKALPLSNHTVYVELGSGRGRLGLFMSSFLPGKIICLEANPLFCKRLKKIKHKFSLSNLEIFQTDYFEIPLKGDIFYLCDLFISEEEVKILVNNICKNNDFAILITVGFSLSFMHIQPLKVLKGDFLWGKSEIYIQELRNGS